MRRFDTRALYDALEAQRRERGQTWEHVAREVGVSVSTPRRTAESGRLEVDGMIRMVDWLGRTVESFVGETDA